MSPLKDYDRFFGGQPGAARKARASMRKTYGQKEGDHVFYGTIAKRKRRSEKPPKRTK